MRANMKVRQRRQRVYACLHLKIVEILHPVAGHGIHMLQSGIRFPHSVHFSIGASIKDAHNFFRFLTPPLLFDHNLGYLLISVVMKWFR